MEDDHSIERYREPNNQEKIIAAEEIGYEALAEVAEKYGTGFEDTDGAMPPEVRSMAYHNLQHSWRVRDIATMLAEHHGLNEYDQALVKMIASAHDVVHEENALKSAEDLSVDWLINKMVDSGFSKEDQDIARLAILGTIPITDTEGNFIGQTFPLTFFPSERSGEIALCIAAADLEALFAHYGPLESHNLFKERRGLGIYDAPADLESLIEFQKQQISLMDTFQPLYPELEILLGDLRQEIAEHHRTLLAAIISGHVTAWDQVVAWDTEFAERFKP